MAILKYTVARLGLVVVIFVVCYALTRYLIFSAVIAMIAAFCISYLFFGRLRQAAIGDMRARANRTERKQMAGEADDAAAEDGFWDEQPGVRPNTGPEKPRS